MTASNCVARQYRTCITVFAMLVSVGVWSLAVVAEAAPGPEEGSQAGDLVQHDGRRNSVYLEAMGRSVSLWSLHFEVAALDDLAVEGGVGYVSVDGYKGLHGDIGLTYWAWSAGASAIVLNLTLVAAGVIDPLTDHYYGTDPTDPVACVPYWLGGFGLGAGIFYEFRSGILLRVGVTPTVWFYSKSPWISDFLNAVDLPTLVAVQVGWSF